MAKRAKRLIGTILDASRTDAVAISASGHAVGRPRWQRKQPKHWRNSPPRCATRTFRRASASTARRCCSMRWPAPSPAGSARRPARSRRWRRALAQGAESSVIGGDHLSLAGATLLNAYLVTAVTMCDVHRETMTHVTPEVMPPALAIAERDGLSGRALLTAIAAGCEVTTRVGIGTDYPKFRARGWHGPGIFGPFGAAAAVGSLLEIRCRHHGARFRARRQPGRRHVCRLGHADGEIPPVPRRAIGIDGGAVGAAKIRRHARVPHRQGRRPLQHLCGRRQTGSRHGRSRHALGARAHRHAAVAVGNAHSRHEHRAVRSARQTQHRSGAHRQGPHRA